MKSVTILLVIFLISILSVPTAQAAEQSYASLKNAYIQNHPGQSLIPFPWEPSTSIKVLPFDYEIPAAPGNTLSVTACRDQFEAASFILNAQKDISGIGITVPNLYNAQGNSIPADALDVRLVKVWYQADDASVFISHPGSRYLTPELLLKDDSLVKVDYVNKINYLKVTLNGNQQYIDISNPAGTFPSNAQIRDTSSLQPFSLKTNENKQVWLTVHVPDSTPAGDYYGDISITTPSEPPVKMNVRVTVLPFDLEPAPLEYAIYYLGRLTATSQEKVNTVNKTSAQYTIELQNLKDHGIAYPTMSQEDWSMMRTALLLRNQSGLPSDHIYLTLLQTGTSSNADDLARLQDKIDIVRDTLSPFGYRDMYLYGKDEATGDVLRSERTVWRTVHSSGAKVFVACFDDAVDIVGDLLDVAVLNGPLNPAQVAKWHSFGKRVFSYDNPQVGVENPDIYRRNFGFALWNAGYDGAMDYAYQHTSGQSIWNDFDFQKYRDHVFAYPTSNGVIDTIQWEGWREGVDDTRYLASLKKHEGNYTSARAVITDSLSRGDKMATIRNTIINRILVSHSAVSVPAPGPTATEDELVKAGIFNGVWNLDVNGNGIREGAAIDTSFRYGAMSDNPVVGDWDGDGKDGIAIFRPSTGFWYFDNNLDGKVDKSYRYGGASDRIIKGDWDGDGKDGIAIFRPSTGFWYFDNNLDGKVDKSYRYGGASNRIIKGDWDGDGKDGIAIFRPSTGFWYFDNNLDGKVDKSYRYGGASDRIIKGDWDGDGKDGIAIFRPSTGFWYFDNNLDGKVDKSFRFGGSTDQIIAGDWNGNGRDDIGIFRPSTGYWYFDANLDGIVDKAFRFGTSGDIPVVGAWT